MFKTVQIVAKKAASPLARKESLVILQKRASSNDAVPEEIEMGNSYYEEATPGQIKERGSAYHAIYRPNKDTVKGAAFQFLFTPSKKAVFITAAKQKGEKLPPRTKGEQFDYKNKIVVKVGVSEIPNFLRVLRLKTKEIDLLHSTERATQTIKMKTGERNTFWIALTRKEVNGQGFGANKAAKADQNGPPSFDDIPFDGEAKKDSKPKDSNAPAAPKAANTIGMYIDENEGVALDVFFTEAMKKAMGF